MTVTKAKFTKALHAFLARQGYTHIYSLGIRPKPGETEDGEDYILIPLKSGDPRLQYQETDMHIDVIDSPEVIEMAAGDEFISFFAEIPMELYDTFYLNTQ